MLPGGCRGGVIGSVKQLVGVMYESHSQRHEGGNYIRQFSSEL